MRIALTGFLTPCRLDDLTSSVPTSTSPVPASTVNTLPSEAHPRLPKRLRPRRRRKRKTAVAANDNSASREADLATPLVPSANRNSSRWASSVATRPRSAANDLPGFQPGTRNALKKHPQSFTSSQPSQHPDPAANQNRDRPFCQDHSEIRGVYKPAQIDPRHSCLSDPTECTATPALSCPNSWLACWLVRQLADRGGESLKVDPRRI